MTSFCKVIFFAFFVLGSYYTKAQKCEKPIYKITWQNVTQPNLSDGFIRISEMSNLSHYEVVIGENALFDFEQATIYDPSEAFIELKGLSNPTGTEVYWIRMYNGRDCFRTEKIELSQLFFAKDRENTAVELIQGVDNPSPGVGDIVTFTTLIQSKGTTKVENLEVTQYLTGSLEVIFFFADRGNYNQTAKVWNIGELKGGESLKLVVRARVKTQGLSYATSFISSINQFDLLYGQSIPTQDSDYKTMATSCVSVPISIQANQSYRIVLPDYEGITWYYKDPAGNYSKIDEFTNPNIAEINPDSSLNIKQGGEFTFTKKVDACTFSSCCPVLVESCAGPPIIIDSIYCNSNVDSYDILVTLNRDNFSVIEKVYWALANIGYPVLTNYLNRINSLPLSSSSGIVTSLGNGRYKVSNVPAFMPNVTLVSTDMSGQCRTVKVVNAPDCSQAMVLEPVLAEATTYFLPGEGLTQLKIENKERGLRAEWYSDELGTQLIGKGRTYIVTEPGTYYVAYVNKRTGARSIIKEALVKDLAKEQPGMFVDVAVCDCKNPSMIPTGKLDNVAVAKAFPNPANDILNIQFRLPSETQKAELLLFNINGRKMAAFDLDVKGSLQQVNVKSWVDGTYVYNILTDGQKKLSQKILVRH